MAPNRLGVARPRILISHGDPRGSANLGDLAMLANVVRKLGEAIPGAEFRMLGIPAPAPWRIDAGNYVPEGVGLFDDRLHPATESLMRLAVRFRLAQSLTEYRRGWAEKLALPLRTIGLRKLSASIAIDNLLWADVLVETGHGGFTELFWEPDIADKLFLIRLAKSLGKPVVLTSHGYGPIRSPKIYATLRESIDDVDFLGVRTKSGLTWDTVSALNLNSVTPQFVGDDAADLPNASQERVDEILDLEGVPQATPLLAAHIRGRRAGGGSHIPETFARVLNKLIHVLRIHVVVVPMRRSGRAPDLRDAQELKKLVSKPSAVTVLNGDYDWSETRGVIGRCAIGFGMAYHFAVFCLNQGVPCLTLSSSDYYQGKVGGILTDFGFPEWLIPLHKIEARETLDLAKHVLRDTSIRSKLLLTAADWSKRSHRPIEAVHRALSLGKHLLA